MKFILLLILSLITFNSCVERENFVSTGMPPVSGLFTEIGGNIAGKLLRIDSPYLVNEDLIIGSSDTLIIEPGCEIYFDDGKTLIVNGTLISIGSTYRPILYTAYNEYWEGIKFSNSLNENRIQFSIIEKIRFEKMDSSVQSAISLVNSYADFKNNYFIDNKSRMGGAIGVRNSQLIIYNSIFKNNSSQFPGGAIYSINSYLKMINCVLYKNTTQSNGASVYIQSHISSEIQNNIFYKNTLQGIQDFFFQPTDSSGLIEQYNFYGDNENDPMFLFDDDFRLYYQSPCKDAGNPDPIFNDIDGSRNDQGVYGGPYGGW